MIVRTLLLPAVICSIFTLVTPYKALATANRFDNVADVFRRRLTPTEIYRRQLALDFGNENNAALAVRDRLSCAHKPSFEVNVQFDHHIYDYGLYLTCKLSSNITNIANIEHEELLDIIGLMNILIRDDFLYIVQVRQNRFQRLLSYLGDCLDGLYAARDNTGDPILHSNHVYLVSAFNIRHIDEIVRMTMQQGTRAQLQACKDLLLENEWKRLNLCKSKSRMVYLLKAQLLLEHEILPPGYNRNRANQLGNELLQLANTTTHGNRTLPTPSNNLPTVDMAKPVTIESLVAEEIIANISNLPGASSGSSYSSSSGSSSTSSSGSSSSSGGNSGGTGGGNPTSGLSNSPGSDSTNSSSSESGSQGSDSDPGDAASSSAGTSRIAMDISGGNNTMDDSFAGPTGINTYTPLDVTAQQQPEMDNNKRKRATDEETEQENLGNKPTKKRRKGLKNVRWQEGEIARVRTLCKEGVFSKDIVKILNREFHNSNAVRTIPAVRRLIQINKDIPRRVHKWSPKEVIRLKQLKAQNTNSGDIARILNIEFHKGNPIRTHMTVRYKVNKKISQAAKQIPWEEKERTKLRSLYKEGVFSKDIANILNREFHDGKTVRTRSSVRGCISRDKSIKIKKINRWTLKEAIRLKKLKVQNTSNHDIAQILNNEFHNGDPIRNRASIVYKLVELNPKAKKQNKWKDDERKCCFMLKGSNLTLSEIAENINNKFHKGKPVRTPSSINNLYSRHNHQK